MKKYSNQHIEHHRKKSIKGNAPKRKRKSNVISNNDGSENLNHNPKDLYAPKNMMLNKEYCEETIRYINKIKNTARKYRNIGIRLDNVENLGQGAISMLLSVIKDTGRKRFIGGTSPMNENADRILEESGFFSYMKRSYTIDKQKISKNTILTKGTYNTPPDEMAEEVRNSMKTVWGINGRNPLLYGGVFEMIRNTCDHAFKNQSSVKWYFSISHYEDQNLARFSFVDNGEGILNTMAKRGLKGLLLDLFKGNDDIIETAFKNGIESRTGLSWRGIGLPTIYELLEDKVVKNLVVITDDVYINFDKKVKFTLTNKFSGTYYYWEIDQTCKKYCFE